VVIPADLLSGLYDCTPATFMFFFGAISSCIAIVYVAVHHPDMISNAPYYHDPYQGPFGPVLRTIENLIRDSRLDIDRGLEYARGGVVMPHDVLARFTDLFNVIDCLCRQIGRIVDSTNLPSSVIDAFNRLLQQLIPMLDNLEFIIDTLGNLL